MADKGEAIPEEPSAEPEIRKAKGRKASAPEEIGGPKGPEPTRYGDWERRGIAVDF